MCMILFIQNVLNEKTDKNKKQIIGILGLGM